MQNSNLWHKIRKNINLLLNIEVGMTPPLPGRAIALEIKIKSMNYFFSIDVLTIFLG